MAKDIIEYSTADIKLNNGLTLAEEKFALEYIERGNAAQAYLSVFGRKATRQELKDLNESPVMIRRVTALYNMRLAIMQNSCQVDVDLLVRELEQARQVAIHQNEASAAIAATMGKAKLHGLLVDRKEINIKRPEDMTEAEIREALGIEFIEAMALGRASEAIIIEESENDMENAEKDKIEVDAGEGTC